jgi:hypothetical protein
MVIGFIIGFIPGFALGFLGIDEALIQVVAIIVGGLFFHITLHGGTWGFVPASNQQAAKN